MERNSSFLLEMRWALVLVTFTLCYNWLLASQLDFSMKVSEHLTCALERVRGEETASLAGREQGSPLSGFSCHCLPEGPRSWEGGVPETLGAGSICVGACCSSFWPLALKPQTRLTTILAVQPLLQINQEPLAMLCSPWGLFSEMCIFTDRRTALSFS